MADFPMGGFEADYNSKKSRARIVNLIPEGDKKGYTCLKRAEGLTLFATGMEAPVRSNILVNGGFIYVVSGSKLYRVNSDGIPTSLGSVNGSGRAKLAANAIPGDSEILVLNGSGVGYLYSVALGLVTISDPDFFASSSVTILNERFWLARDGTNEFFGSDISDGQSYNPLTFASAEENPDEVKAVIAKKSSLYVLNEKSIEQWQSTTDITLPLRRINGASKERGIAAIDSLADVGESFAFLADDRTVKTMTNGELQEISDHAFRLKVKGNGTPDFPGFAKIDDAIGFFVDGPIHKTYYLTFPSEGYTWGFDLNTGLPHTRESEGFGYWRVNATVLYKNKIICGDIKEGKLWMLDPANRTEDGNFIRAKLITPSISMDRDITIPRVEFDMEVSQTTSTTLDPQMMVEFTRDGGNSWITKDTVPLGKIGNTRTRVPSRFFGRLVRNKDFALSIEVTDPVGFQIYGIKFYPEVSI